MKAKISEIFESLFNQELRLILRNPISIGSISEPSEDLQCTAVRLDEHAINMISKPCERAKKYGEIISDSGKQLAEFFTSCLDLSKMEMQEWASNTTVFSIKKLMEGVRALYLPEAMSNNLLLKLDYDENLPEFVEGHRDSLYRVLLNLVGNAIKFTEQGGVILRSKMLRNIESKQIDVEFQVQDTGIGIPEDKHKIIFEKLHRLTPSYESQIAGSGIGLYIADQYIKRLDGEIRVDSKVGEGSTFTVTLSLRIADDEAGLSHPEPGLLMVKSSEVIREKITRDVMPLNNSENQSPENLPRVLLVEDTEMVQFVTKSLLNSAGFSVDIASSGEEALEMFEPSKYGLIYMDIGLPKMNGYETTKAIRQKEKFLNAAEEVLIIALTGHGALDVQAFCGEAGMQGILSKPLSLEQADLLWKFLKKDKNISVPGLTLLTPSTSKPLDDNILDIEAMIKIMGSKDIALSFITTLVDDLKNHFLPQIKTFILESKRGELLFLLHQQIGALAYAKSARLEKTLSDVKTMVQNGVHIDKVVYQEIEKEALRVVDVGSKIKSNHSAALLSS